MKQIYLDFKTVIATEFIKKKRSGIFYLSVILGIIVPVITTISKLIKFNTQSVAVNGASYNLFESELKNQLLPYATFFLPLLTIMCASRIAQIDHKNKGWQLMETMPVTKFTIYFSKFLILIIANILSIITFLAVILFFGWLFTLFYKPSAHVLVSVPWVFILKVALRLFIAVLSVTAFQYVLSVRVRSFVWPLVIGFFSLLLPLFLKAENIILNWYPYTFLNQVYEFIDGSDLGYFLTYSEWLSIFYAVILLFIGYRWYAFKNIVNAFFTKKLQWIKSLAVLAIFGLLIAFTLKPKTLPPHNKTVITGTLESNINLNEAVILNKFTRDTITKMAIEDGTFKTYLNDSIPLTEYVISSARGDLASLYFSTHDSINIDAVIFNRPVSFDISGTRLAENLSYKGVNKYYAFTYYLKNNIKIDDERFFMKNIYKQWQREISNLQLLKTVDNVIPRNDYKTLLKKKITAKYLRIWNSYKKKREVLFPDIPYTKTEDIMTLENAISLRDETMLFDREYFNLVKQDLIRKDTTELDEDQKTFKAIEHLKSGSFKSTLLYHHLNNAIGNAQTIKNRDSLVVLYAENLEKESYKALIKKKVKALNALSEGVKAPNFIAYNKDGKNFTLEDFKGSYLLIDVWASWCGPCIAEAPFFESKATAYKDKPIKFVALNTDRDEVNWKVAIKNKNSVVQQLRVKDINQFTKHYDVNSIPRFVLIDPDGKFVNANFLRPRSNAFDTLIKGYLENL